MCGSRPILRRWPIAMVARRLTLLCQQGRVPPRIHYRWGHICDTNGKSETGFWLLGRTTLKRRTARLPGVGLRQGCTLMLTSPVDGWWW